MDFFGILIALCVLCGIWNIVISLIIYNSLKNRGLPVSFLWLRLMIPGYVFQYREVIKAETGQTGVLFYHWIISINLSLLFVILIIIGNI